jgi:hypothetical protein
MISHTRWEQSVHPSDSPNHFEMQWNVTMVFDACLKKLTASNLKIVQYVHHPQMPKSSRELLKETLVGGMFIVC